MMQRLLRVLMVFAILRFVEAGVSVIALVIVDFALGTASPGVEQELFSRADFSGSWTIARTYYLSLGYVYFSALAFVLTAVIVRRMTKKAIVSVNLGAFLAHSLAVISLVFEGKVGLYLWTVWVAVAIFNWLLPIWLWKLRFVRGVEFDVQVESLR